MIQSGALQSKGIARCRYGTSFSHGQDPDRTSRVQSARGIPALAAVLQSSDLTGVIGWLPGRIYILLVERQVPKLAA
jgi:hypothetical protein